MSSDDPSSPLATTAATPAERAHAVADVELHGEQMLSQRVRLFPQALIVGAAVGLLSVAFRLALEHSSHWRDRWLSSSAEGTTLVWVVGAIAMIGVALWLVVRFAPEAAGSGIPHLKLVLQGDFRVRWWRVLPVKFVSGLFAIAAGLALGREGPTIQMGASLGAMWGDLTKRSPEERRSLLVTGASAGLAAAFNAPLAGILFVLEELRINMPDSAFFAALVASITADIVTRALMGQAPVIATGDPPIPSLVDLPFFLLLGVIAGLASGLYNGLLVAVNRWLAFRSVWLQSLKVAIAGTVIGLCGWWDPMLIGGGDALTDRSLDGQGSIAWLSRTLVARFVLSIASYAIGTAGGIFAPLLALGGLMGLLVGKLCLVVFPGMPAEPMAFAAAGMSALFAGVVRCPLAGIVLMIEMTGHYELVIPLTVAAYAATFTADQLQIKPIYDALLEDQHQRSQAGN
jgi:chloride channel protein, CIC family